MQNSDLEIPVGSRQAGYTYCDVLVDLGLVVHQSRVAEAKKWLADHVARLAASGELENWISIEPAGWATPSDADDGWDEEE